MKKAFFTLVLMAIVTVMSAQSIQFEYEGTVYQDGQSVIMPYDSATFEYVQHMQIRNLTGEDLNVVVEQYVIETVPGVMAQLCWGMCMVGDTILSDPQPIPAQSVSAEGLLSSHVSFFEGETGVVSMICLAYVERHPDEAIALHLMAGQGTNVAEHRIGIGQAYPNPATTQVHFNLEGNESGINAVIYNLLGQEVKSLYVGSNQNRVNIDVTNLQPGIYFCRFSANGAVVSTEKFIVRH